MANVNENEIIQLEHVSKIYPTGQKAITQLDLTIGKGEFVLLEGESGAGKTTLLDLLLKDTEPTEGTIRVNGIDTGRLKKRQIYRYRRMFGVVFQDFKLFSDFTVYENVAFALRVSETAPEKIRAKVMEALREVGLERKAKLYPGQLSGGECQRSAVARAIVNQPAILLADEPTGNLDRKNAMEVMWLLHRINEGGTTVLVVSHSQEILKNMKKRIVTLQHGRIIKDSSRGGYFYGN